MKVLKASFLVLFLGFAPVCSSWNITFGERVCTSIFRIIGESLARGVADAARPAIENGCKNIPLHNFWPYPLVGGGVAGIGAAAYLMSAWNGFVAECRITGEESTWENFRLSKHWDSLGGKVAKIAGVSGASSFGLGVLLLLINRYQPKVSVSSSG